MMTNNLFYWRTLIALQTTIADKIPFRGTSSSCSIANQPQLSPRSSTCSRDSIETRIVIKTECSQSKNHRARMKTNLMQRLHPNYHLLSQLTLIMKCKVRHKNCLSSLLTRQSPNRRTYHLCQPSQQDLLKAAFVPSQCRKTFGCAKIWRRKN